MPPLVLRLAAGAPEYVAPLWILFALFVLRVAGQVIVFLRAPGWLPPMGRWYSGLMPYQYLLPSQLAIMALMVVMIGQVSRGGASSGVAGAAEVWASYLYAAGMIVRLVKWLRDPPERRGVFIPIVFHFVLAAFLFVHGSARLIAP